MPLYFIERQPERRERRIRPEGWGGIAAAIIAAAYGGVRRGGLEMGQR